MVYRNLINTTTFSSEAGTYSGSDNATVELEVDEYTFEKTADPAVWSGEGTITYTITLTVNDGEDLSDITVVDNLPEGVTFIETTVEIDGQPSTNFDATSLPTITFGSEEQLVATSEKALVIIFQVEAS